MARYSSVSRERAFLRPEGTIRFNLFALTTEDPEVISYLDNYIQERIARGMNPDVVRLDIPAEVEEAVPENTKAKKRKKEVSL